MLIATPISDLFKKKNYYLQNIKKISDCFEARDRTSNLKVNKTLLFHFDIDLTLEWNCKIKEYICNNINEKKNLKLISFQSTRCCFIEKKNNKGIFRLVGKKISKRKLISNSISNTIWLKKNFPKLKIALENNNYYPTPAYNYITDAEFLSEVVKKNNIFFLLDIAHALITSINKKISYNEYLEKLPLQKLIQIHICGPLIRKNKLAFDKHFLPQKKMYDLARDIIKKHKLKFITLEYYKNSKLLLKELKKIKNELCK